METSNMKNIVVLKNLPSNIVEEAIVVLKNTNKIKQYKVSETKKENGKTESRENDNSQKYIIKEAEMLISNYISDIEKPKINNKTNQKLQKKYHRLRTLTIGMTIMMILSIMCNLLK